MLSCTQLHNSYFFFRYGVCVAIKKLPQRPILGTSRWEGCPAHMIYSFTFTWNGTYDKIAPISLKGQVEQDVYLLNSFVFTLAFGFIGIPTSSVCSDSDEDSVDNMPSP